MFFSKKISTNSESQFKSDFGEYPPKPLSPMKLNTQFNILSKGKVGLFFYNVSQIFSTTFLTVVGKSPLHTSSQALIFWRNNMVKVRKNILKIKTRLIKGAIHFKKSTFQMKFVFFVLILIACSTLLLFLLLFIVYQFIKKI